MVISFPPQRMGGSVSNLSRVGHGPGTLGQPLDRTASSQALDRSVSAMGSHMDRSGSVSGSALGLDRSISVSGSHTGLDRTLCLSELTLNEVGKAGTTEFLIKY